MESFSVDALLQMRMWAQGLARREHPHPSRVVRAVCGLQAQDAAAATLALRARGQGFTSRSASDLLQTGALLRAWCMRGTLHLLHVDDVAWIVALIGPKVQRASRRRREQLGLDSAKIEAVGRSLRDLLTDGRARTRKDLAERLAERGIELKGQAVHHALRHHALEGTIALAEDRERNPVYVLVGEAARANAVERSGALAELARRYLAAYGPATVEDFASWSGLGTRDVRTGWRGIESETVPVAVGGREMRMDPVRRGRWEDAWDAPPPVRLLPAFDTYLLGYASRDLMLDADHARRVHPGGGILRPTVALGGRIVGTWRSKRKRNGIEIDVESFAALDAAARDGIAAEVADIGRFLGMPAEAAG